MEKKDIKKSYEGLVGILFDADGTLIDTYNMILRSMRYTMETELDMYLSDKDLMAGVGTPLFDQMLVFADGNSEMAQHLVEVYRAHMGEAHDRMIQAFFDTKAALERLQAAGYKMAVVTSKPHQLAVHGLEMSGICKFFEFVVGADDYPEHKPAPGPILFGCKKLGIEPAQCMYVGDSPYDMEAGNAAGCMTCAALWGMFTREELLQQHPSVLCESLTELADLLGA